jgi:hypothetical protein
MIHRLRALAITTFCGMASLCLAQALPKYEIIPLTVYEAKAPPNTGRWFALKVDRSLKKFSKCIAVVDVGMTTSLSCAPAPELAAYPGDMTRSSFAAPMHEDYVTGTSTVMVWSINNDTGTVTACATSDSPVRSPCASTP